MNDDPGFAKRVLDNGATGLVLKEMADSDLPTAVREASRGRRYVSPPPRQSSAAANDRHDRLTPREREVLRLIALGHTSVEIAREAGAFTAHDRDPPCPHPPQAGAHTRAELVRYALRQDMLQL